MIVLGAYVRLSHAGLGCPDWPGCYGHLTAGQAAENQQAVNAAFPERPIEYDKALKEMLHRYLATTLGLADPGDRARSPGATGAMRSSRCGCRWRRSRW